MKIAFYGSSLLSSYWNGAATYYRGLLSELARRGHTITFYEPDAFDRQQHKDIEPPDYARVVVYPATDEAVRKVIAEAAKADVVVKASGVGVFDNVLLEGVTAAARPGAIRMICDVDAPATLAEIRANLDGAKEARAEAVADALLSGADAADAADAGPTREALATERETLLAAITTLDQRERQIKLRIDGVQDEAEQAVSAALADMSGALRTAAREAAQVLLACFANAVALEQAVRGSAGKILPYRQAAEGLSGSDHLIAYRQYLPVSAELIELQGAVRKLGPSVRKWGVIAQTATPIG